MRLQSLLMVTCAWALTACGADLDSTDFVSQAAALERAVDAPGDEALAPDRGVDAPGGDPDRGGGGIIVDGPVIHPATAKPVVYRQVTLGSRSAGYSAAWSRNRRLGYHPAGLNATRSASGVRYTGLWHRDDRVVNWSSHRNLTDAEYLDLWADKRDAGFRVLDLDAHRSGSAARYHAIFVRDASPKEWRSHRRLTAAGLNDKIAEYGALGMRPTRVQGYLWGNHLRFAAVFVKDGKTDIRFQSDLSHQGFAFADAIYRGQGFVPYDIGPYRTAGGALRYTGLWVEAHPSVVDFRAHRNLTANGLRELNETYTRQNLVLVDVDGYRSGAVTRFTAVWHRPVVRQLVQASKPYGGDPNILALGAAVAEFSTNGNDGRRGTLGFFVQDLQTGDYVSMNQHEPFYMASTSKVLIGARVASHADIDMADTRFFGNSRWRGESNRGFTQADLGQNQTIQTYMNNMLQGSDTASTDLLWGVLRGLDGNSGLDDWLRDVAGLQNVGEVTDICQVDKRISASSDSCVNAVSCDTFETWFRGGVMWNATQAEQDCLNGVPNSHRSLENHENYYTTLANTITPAEFGRFWTRLAAGDLMDNADRGAFLATIDPTWDDGFNTFQASFYDVFGTKNGGKRRVSAQVGFMWDWNGAVGDYTDITPRYAFTFVAEDWNFEDNGDADNDGTSNHTEWARAAMRAVLSNSLTFLQN